MVKKYIEGETKEQRKVRKALDKVQRSVEDVQSLPQKSVNKYYVLCLKHGTKYSYHYVNRLYNMVKRHCSLNVEFVCLTDDTIGINKDITTVLLPEGIEGWWCKPFMFSDELPLNGTILYMDLDVVIGNNIDKLFTFQKDKWCTIRDFTRKMRPKWEKYNSSVVRFESGKLTHLWKDFKLRQKEIQRKFFGDQDWLYDVTHKDNPPNLFPDAWIQSWKWEIRSSKDLNYGLPRGKRKLRTIEHVVPPEDCCICVFHGDPNPSNCEDPWVINNWK